MVTEGNHPRRFNRQAAAYGSRLALRLAGTTEKTANDLTCQTATHARARIPATLFAPGLCQKPQTLWKRGRGECRALVAPAASRGKQKRASVVTARTTGITRHSRTRMVLTVYSALSLVIGLSCHHHRRNARASSPT